MPWYRELNATFLNLLLRSELKSRQHIKEQTHNFADRDLPSQSYGFSSSHVQMWELYHKESWVLKNWCFQTMVLKNTLVSPLDCNEIQPVNPKGNQSWILIGRTDAEAPILMWRTILLEKTLMLGKIEGSCGWQRLRWLDSIIDPRDMSMSKLQEIMKDGILTHCSPWGCKELDST